MANVIYKCSCCGGNLEFDPKSQMLKCPYCDEKYDVADYDKSNFKLTVEYENANKTIDNESGVTTYKCESCGGSIVTDGVTTATFCPYCGNSTILKGDLDGEFAPNVIIPFEKTDKQAIASFLAECKRRPLCPKEFRSEYNIQKIKGIYVPYFLYDFEVEGSVTFDARKISVSRTSSATTTTTKYYDATRECKAEFEKVPHDASEKMDDGEMSAIEPFNYRKSMPFSIAYMTGFFAEQNDVSKETCEQNLKSVVNRSTINFVERNIDGYDTLSYTHDNLTQTVQNVELALMPVYTLKTKYRGKNYSFAMNGQTGKLVGKFPICKKKAVSVFGITAVISYALSLAIYLMGGI